jgi:hypothetical protein
MGPGPSVFGARGPKYGMMESPASARYGYGVVAAVGGAGSDCREGGGPEGSAGDETDGDGNDDTEGDGSDGSGEAGADGDGGSAGADWLPVGGTVVADTAGGAGSVWSADGVGLLAGAEYVKTAVPARGSPATPSA